MSNNLKRIVAWLATASLVVGFAMTPTTVAAAYANWGWVAQNGTVSPDGKATQILGLHAGDTVPLSITLKNLTGTTIQPKSALPLGSLQVPKGSFGIGTRRPQDGTPSFLDASSFILNNNRFVYYEGAPVAPNAEFTMTWSVKMATGLADGTYKMYVGPVSEYYYWMRQVVRGVVMAPAASDVFWEFVVGTGVSTGGSLNVALAGDTPAAGNVAILAADVAMTKINLTAATSANALISGITVTRYGLSANDDISDIKLYDGTTKIGSTQGLNSTTGKAVFTGLALLIPAGTIKVLTIKGTFPSTADVGKIVALGIALSTDVTLSGGGTISGAFPATGHTFTVGGITVGYLAVTANTTPAASNLISGSTDQDVASFKFDASSTENFNVNSITFTEIGTSASSDASNFKLKYLGTQIGSTVASMTGDEEVTFTGSPLFTVNAGTNKNIYLACDIASGITSARTIRFEINDTPDVIAVGASSMGTVTVTADTSGTAFTAAQGKIMTIIQGSVTVAKSATNLSAQTYIVGQVQAEMSKFKFSAGSDEALKVTKIVFAESEDATASDYQNARLYINDSATPLDLGGSVGSATITFEDGNGLFIIPKSGNTEVTLKVDLSTGSTSAAATYRVGIGTASTTYTAVTMYGVDSNAKVPQDSSHITLTSCAASDMSIHEVDAAGTLVVSNGPNTPITGNFALGTTAFEIHQFRMQALAEAAQVTAVTVRFYDDTATAGADAANLVGTHDVENAKLYWLNGTTWTLLDEISTPASGVASFTFDHTIARNVTETFKVTADIPTAASLTSLFTGVAGTADLYNIYDEVIASGVSSGHAYGTGDTSGLSDSYVFTKVAPIITVLASTIPAAHTLVVNGTDQLIGKFFLTANDVENIKISTIKTYFSSVATMVATDNSSADTELSNVHLAVDGSSTLTTIPKAVTDGGATGIDYITFSGADFNNPTTWLVPKGGSLIIGVYADIIAASDVSLYLGMTAVATNVVGAGASSSTDATIYDSGNNAFDAVWASPLVTLSSGGTLTVAVATDTPSVQQVTMSYGTTTLTPTFSRFKVTATNESMRVDALRAKVADAGNAAEDDNFLGTVYVYEGGTMSGNVLTGGTLVGQGSLIPVASADSAADIVFTTPVTVASGSSKYLTLTADMNTSTGGADSGDVPYIGLDYSYESGYWTGFTNARTTIKVIGLSSNAPIYYDGSAILKGSAAYVVKARLGMALATGTPYGEATRSADHTIMKLAMTNTSAETDARFRAAAINSADTETTAFAGAFTTATTWSTVVHNADSLCLFDPDATNYVDGAASLQMTQGSTTPAAGDGMKATFAATDLSEYTGMGFWYRTSRASIDLTVTLTGASAGSHTVNPGTNDQWEFELIPFTDATAFTGRTAVTAFSIVSATAYTANDTLNIDGLVFYKDYIKMSLTSDAGLFAATGATNTAVTLKDGTSTVATGYVGGTLATTFVSTSQAAVYWFPTTEMAISASGKTYNIVADTTALITAISKDLTMTIGLGSASSAGAITAGNVLWNDNSATTGIGWVYSTTDTSLTRSLNF
jgi:hypothetical protein